MASIFWHNIPTCLKNLNVYQFSNQIKLYLFSEQLEISIKQGCSEDFSKGGGGHTGSNNIVMAFSPRYIVGCLLKKRLIKGGGHGHRRTPLATPM